MPKCTKGHEARCREAKGPAAECECRCGGKHHGADREGPPSRQITTPLRGEPTRTSKPAIPCVNHAYREATTASPTGEALCDPCAHQLGIETDDR